jgi:hypothetical protein
MIGCVQDKDGNVRYTGTSANYPRINLSSYKSFGAEYRLRRKHWLGERLYSYDEFVQSKLIADAKTPIGKLSAELQATRQKLARQPWAVFRGELRCQIEHPQQWGPGRKGYVPSLLTHNV